MMMVEQHLVVIVAPIEMFVEIGFGVVRLGIVVEDD